MKNFRLHAQVLLALSLGSLALGAQATTFSVQCPTHTPLHPLVDINGNPPAANNNSPDPATYKYPNPHIKCQQLSGGDGFATMGDGTQIYLFAFGPLSGLGNLVKGLPGTVTAEEFNQNNLDGDGNVLEVIKQGAPDSKAYNFNGAIGLVPDVELNDGSGPDGAPLDGHVDPRLIMDVGVLNGNSPAPMIAIDEGDELFITLTNVGQVMRPDLFEQHTVHFHGYANASAFYDGVPDASVAINVGGSFTYYYLAPEAGTYMWHCHISPPEHLQMGMVGQIYVRPKQNSVVGNLRNALLSANKDSIFGAAKSAAGAGEKCNDILCAGQTPAPAEPPVAVMANGRKYAYNDGDGSTSYDVEYPVQMMGFDPNFHFVGMTFNPESFADNKDKYFLLNGRSYPDTINPEPMKTQSSDTVERTSQPLPAVINIPVGGKALLRFSDLNVTEYHTLASLGIPMHVVGMNARLLRDLDGNNMDYYTNSITLAGGESVDVILEAECKSKDASTGNCLEPFVAGEKYYLYTPQLDHLSNDAENFGGMMTEVNICNAVDPTTKQCS